MRIINKYIRAASILAMLVCWAGLGSCIKEDMSDCPEDMRIYLTFTPATYARTGIDPREVDRLDLFAFDAEGIFRGVWTDEHPVLASGYYMTIPRLPAGDYRFVVWGAMHEPYSTTPAIFKVGETLFADAQLNLNIPSGGTVAAIRPLFHALATERVRADVRTQHIEMPLWQAYNTINLTTEGFDPAGDQFRMSVTDSNGNYYFDYSFAPCGEFTYATPCGTDAQGQLKASLDVLRLAADRHPRFEIRNMSQQKTLYEADLVELLNKMGEIDYAGTHTYDIHIKFATDNTDMTATVTINGWQVTEDSEVLY